MTLWLSNLSVKKKCIGRKREDQMKIVILYLSMTKKIFFRTSSFFYKFPDGMAPVGQFNFPFSFQAIPNLSSSFAFLITAAVYYKLKEILMNSSYATLNIQFQLRMIIQNNLKDLLQI